MERSKQFKIVVNNVRPKEKTASGHGRARNNGKTILFCRDGNTAITCWDASLTKFYNADDKEYHVANSHLSAKAKGMIKSGW